MENTSDRSSAELQHEIDQDRRRIESRIDAIHERMSPGQLVDEVIAYAKGSGGGEYVTNLGSALKANPLPVALIGVSLAWLMAKGSEPSSSSSTWAEPDYPLYPVTGPVRRLGPPEKLGGVSYSHFADSSGNKLKALTDETGRRAGHFIDEAGKTYRGFVDANGKRIDSIMDESGAMLDAASGWAAEKWEQAKAAVGDISGRASTAANSLSDRSASAAASLQQQTGKLNELIMTQFRDQPLVGGALAFALGAAIGAALPHTETEDQLVGEAADSTKEELSSQAQVLVERGKDVASQVYETAAEAASEAHDTVKESVVSDVGSFKEGLASVPPRT
ncbi:Protein of unknown function (DUF3618) [Rhizobium leguminosarum bv. trifolii WSM2012]|nr:Protein of unknown function (DUF3618) [Rhizobium leguminosarum bv. trifolii WSM2012]EJC76484.1 Protein of unknown function (DUF3618) [Rhizobium leguminosarum bv. trifolii WSM2012]